MAIVLGVLGLVIIVSAASVLFRTWPLRERSHAVAAFFVAGAALIFAVGKSKEAAVESTPPAIADVASACPVES